MHIHIYRERNLIADVYETTPVMSTYLLAFVVGDFGHSELQARPGLKVLLFKRMCKQMHVNHKQTHQK